MILFSYKTYKRLYKKISALRYCETSNCLLMFLDLQVYCNTMIKIYTAESY